MNKNKGAISVLLSVLILSMIVAVGAAVDVSSLAVAKAYAQRINYLSCKSVLAEYNRNLFDDYGLMAFEGGKDEIKDRIQYYTSVMERINEGSGNEIVFFDIELGDISVDCSGKSLAEKERFINQIREIMKLKNAAEGVESLMSVISGKKEIKGQVGTAKEGFAEVLEIEETEEENRGRDLNVVVSDEVEEDVDRVLRSQRTIDSLPSRVKISDENDFLSVDLNNEEELMRLGEESSKLLEEFNASIGAGADRFILIDYAADYFGNRVNEPEGGKETFFNNEMEYILKGYLSDKSNLLAVKKDIFLLRTALNLAHIYSDQEKCRLLLEAAALSGTGPYAAALQFIYATAWAALEAGEDVERLMMGGRVPFIKEKGDWKTDVESIFAGNVTISSDYKGDRGLDYTQYLEIFLLTIGKEKLVERIMDLIQINMKGRYNTEFDLRNHITGFAVSADYERISLTVKMLPGIVEDNLLHIEEEFSY